MVVVHKNNHQDQFQNVGRLDDGRTMVVRHGTPVLLYRPAVARRRTTTTVVAVVIIFVVVLVVGGGGPQRAAEDGFVQEESLAPC